MRLESIVLSRYRFNGYFRFHTFERNVDNYFTIASSSNNSDIITSFKSWVYIANANPKKILLRRWTWEYNLFNLDINFIACRVPS